MNTMPSNCYKCHGDDIVTDVSAGDIVCRSCGEIQASRLIDSSAEWRVFEDDYKSNGSTARSSCTNERFESSSTMFVGGLSQKALAELAKTQLQATDRRELKILKIAEIVSDVGSKLNLTRRILDCAYHLCSRAVMEDTTPIRKNNLLGTAIVSLACRMEGYARTLQEISTVSGVDVQAINKIQSILARELHLDTGVVTAESLIERISGNPLVHCTDVMVIQYAKDICRTVSLEGISDGYLPQAIAVGVLIFTKEIFKLYHDDSSSGSSSSNNNGSSSGNNDNDNNNCYSNSNGNSSSSQTNNKNNYNNSNNSDKSNNNSNGNNNGKPSEINIQKLIEVSTVATKKIKDIYVILCLHANIITPKEIKEKIISNQKHKLKLEKRLRLENNEQKQVSIKKTNIWYDALPIFDLICGKSSEIHCIIKIEKESRGSFTSVPASSSSTSSSFSSSSSHSKNDVNDGIKIKIENKKIESTQIKNEKKNDFNRSVNNSKIVNNNQNKNSNINRRNDGDDIKDSCKEEIKKMSDKENDKNNMNFKEGNHLVALKTTLDDTSYNSTNNNNSSNDTTGNNSTSHSVTNINTSTSNINGSISTSTNSINSGSKRLYSDIDDNIDNDIVENVNLNKKTYHSHLIK